jgi:hypothetical protein
MLGDALEGQPVLKRSIFEAPFQVSIRVPMRARKLAIRCPLMCRHLNGLRFVSSMDSRLIVNRCFAIMQNIFLILEGEALVR